MPDDSWDDNLNDMLTSGVVSRSVILQLRDKSARRRSRHPNRQAGLRAGRSGIGVSALPPTVRVIIELDGGYPGGLEAAKLAVIRTLREGGTAGERLPKGSASLGFVSAELDIAQIGLLTSPDRAAQSAVVKISRDELLHELLSRSTKTINADPSWVEFGAQGEGIVVAVADSGIDGTHPHFSMHRNLELPSGLDHCDFSGSLDGPLSDAMGHGTHVAGIIAGETDPAVTATKQLLRRRGNDDTVRTMLENVSGGPIRGVAPRCKLLSLKVMDRGANGYSSMLIAALQHVHEINGEGADIRVHCVNISMGHAFDAEEFAAGHSPLCVVVNRLSASGVTVVVAAGNDGSAMIRTEAGRQRRIGLAQSINDPGNADSAITVGATHPEFPAKYGVSYFSSRGPTADGRAKPDMIAPGERILSCASVSADGTDAAFLSAGEKPEPGVSYFREESGTSMAAPHVAGAVAAIMSVRPELRGRPADMKHILSGSCTDLNRVPEFQGAGLIDLQRALQSL